VRREKIVHHFFSSPFNLLLHVRRSIHGSLSFETAFGPLENIGCQIRGLSKLSNQVSQNGPSSSY
jgi:hypothetical protein